MSSISSGLVGFPNPVNEKAARVVAGLVALTAVVALLTQAGWLLWLLAAGFLLRVLSGPRFSPFGLLATRVAAPRLGPPKLVPGPPKRFAQGLGLTFSLGAALCVTLGATTLGWTFVGLLVVAATLESAFAFCLGCAAFGQLQRAGLVPESVCEACVVGAR
jgi:MFS family permease